MVRRVKEDTTVALVQSGLPDDRWDRARERYCYFRTLQDRLGDGQTAFEKRVGTTFHRPIIRFRASVEYLQITAKNKSRTHLFGSKTHNERDEVGLVTYC